jgi:H+-transporting ATPase
LGIYYNIFFFIYIPIGIIFLSTHCEIFVPTAAAAAAALLEIFVSLASDRHFIYHLIQAVVSKMSDEQYGTFGENSAAIEDHDDEDPLATHGEHGDKKVFVKSEGLTTAEAERRIKIYGKNELPEKVIPLWYIFLSLLWQPMPMMIWMAAAVEAAISNYLDMSILLMIQFANASIGFYETTKAGDAVAALKASLRPEATVKRDGKWRNIDASFIVPGDLVLLASGSAIPADCRINHGSIDVDQAQLTGESLPVTMYEGNSCMMGSTVVRGEVEATVEFTGVDTFFGKTASLLQV